MKSTMKVIIQKRKSIIKGAKHVGDSQIEFDGHAGLERTQKVRSNEIMKDTITNLNFVFFVKIA